VLLQALTIRTAGTGKPEREVPAIGELLRRGQLSSGYRLSDVSLIHPGTSQGDVDARM
jgi:hypothetical protein